MSTLFTGFERIEEAPERFTGKSFLAGLYDGRPDFNLLLTPPEPPAEKIRGQLSQFGSHWNNTRKCWQHPCGQFATEGSGTDPRTKYGSLMASAARTDLKAP